MVSENCRVWEKTPNIWYQVEKRSVRVVYCSVQCYILFSCFCCSVAKSCLTLFVTLWTAACQASLSFTTFQSLLKSMSTEYLMLSNHLILCHPLLLLQTFLASSSFLMSRFFASSGQSTGASTSASFLPMNIQGWFPLGLTGLISLQLKGVSRVLSSTTIWKHQFFRIQPSLWFNCTFIHDYWKKHRINYMDLR